MKLHHIQTKVRKRSKQRIGRGGKRGSYSGRGVKGQKSRAGRKLRPAQRDLILRLPKVRGFRNKLKSPKPKIFNIADLERSFQGKAGEGTIVNRKFLIEAGLLSPTYAGRIKMLSRGNLSTPITLEGFSVSKETRKKIEAAGGKVKM